MKTLSPFVLEEALAGAPVCDTNGNSVRILGCEESLGEHCVAAVHQGDLSTWKKDGRFNVTGVSQLDLRMAEPLEISDEMCDGFVHKAVCDSSAGDSTLRRERAIARHALKLLAARGLDVAGVCGE